MIIRQGLMLAAAGVGFGSGGAYGLSRVVRCASKGKRHIGSPIVAAKRRV